MNQYFIANIRIKDSLEYQKYINETEKVFSKYNGEYLAVDNTPTLLEGEWDYTRNVIIRFPSKVEFEQWYYSKEYQEILKFRLAAAQCDTILVEGLN